MKLKDLNLDWDDYVIPSKEGKDVEIFHNILKEKYDYTPHDPSEYDRHIFDGQVGLVEWPHEQGQYLKRADLDDNRISSIQPSLESWEAGYLMSREMLDAFMPTDRVVTHSNYGIGCSCGIYGNRPYDGKDNSEVVVMATIGGTVGTAEGIVHELGHHKLHTLGLDLESYTDDIFTNEFKEVFPSPVRFDKDRPISAVVHAEFSYIYVTEYYNHFLDWLYERDNMQWETMGPKPYLQRQAYNLKRIGNGLHTIPRNMKVTEEGERFMESVLNYGRKVWYRGFDHIVQNGFEKEFDWQPIEGKP